MLRMLLICALAVSAAAAPSPRDHSPALNTLAATWDTLLTPTYEWINVYCGAPTLEGVPLAHGDTIFIYDSDGVLAGIDTIRADGSFGFAPVYRDDEFSTVDEGALPGDTLHFAINGAFVRVEPPVVWTANGDKHLACEFWSVFAYYPVYVDIKPGSCPNPFSLNGNLDAGKSVLPVAILGTGDFEVQDINPSTLTLAGAPVVRWSFEDVATPLGYQEDTCACHDERCDGYVDLTLKFSRAEVAPALTDACDRDIVPLVLEGELWDGTMIRGTDCVRVQRNDNGSHGDGGPYGKSTVPGEFALANHPNPFNPTTMIMFTLPVAGDITLRIFDVRGRLVRTLADGSFEAGSHSVLWDGTDGSGRRAASGIYFYRLTANGIDQSRKMLLMK